MDKLTIKKSTLSSMYRYCTASLIKNVFDNFESENMIIDKTNKTDDFWEFNVIPSIGHIQLLNKLKVVYVFAFLGGNIVLNGNVIPYQSLFRILNCNEPNIVLRYWVNNIYNDIVPVFDLGEIEIPPIMPRYILLQIANNDFRIEKWEKGYYILMPEIFFSKELCEQRIQQLNDEYEFEPII